MNQKKKTGGSQRVGTLMFDLESETLSLKISNLQDVNVPRGSTLLIENLRANGKVRLTVVEDLIQYSGAASANKKRGITVQISR